MFASKNTCKYTPEYCSVGVQRQIYLQNSVYKPHQTSRKHPYSIKAMFFDPVDFLIIAV